MSGTVNISREIWHDTAFKVEPFTEREAFIWLIMEASYVPRKKRVGNVEVSLKRGQLAASVRFMCEAWNWSKSRADRFLKRLENRDMIGTDSGTGVNVITVCKYDEYQNKPKGGGTGGNEKRDSSGTAAGQQRDKPNKGLIQDAIKEEDTNVSLSASPDPTHANDLSQAVSRFNDAARAAGWSQVQKLTPTRSKQLRQRLKDCGGIDGWETALRKAFESDFCRGRTDRPWHGFGFDWLTKTANFTKLMEGNYDNRTDRTEPSDRPANRPDAALENIARLAGLGEASGNAGAGAGGDGEKGGSFRMGSGPWDGSARQAHH